MGGGGSKGTKKNKFSRDGATGNNMQVTKKIGDFDYIDFPYLPINKVHDDNALEHPKCFVSIGAMNTVVSGQIILG